MPILHQATREKDEQNRVTATIEDYRAVRELIAEPVSDGVGATVSPTTRETSQAVKKDTLGGNASATLQQCATVLKLDNSAVSRRVKVCIKKGYLINNQNQRGRPMQLATGEHLPEELEDTTGTRKVGVLHCCKQNEGY